MEQQIKSIFRAKKQFILTIIYDLVSLIIAFLSAIILKFDNFDFLINTTNGVILLLAIVLIKLLLMWSFGTYKVMWKYLAIPDIITLFKIITISSVLTYILLFISSSYFKAALSLLIIDWILSFVFLSTGRILYRFQSDFFGSLKKIKQYRALLVGAGEAGQQLLREFQKNISLNTEIVGLIDDNIEKKGKIINGREVLGSISELDLIVQKTRADKIFIAIPSATSEEMEYIISSCKKTGLEFKTLPKLTDIVDGRVILQQLKEVSLEDLLGRKEIILEPDRLISMLKDKIIMVTGAGGSIGSELCFQLARFHPKKIIFFEQSELAIYSLEQEFKERFPFIDYIAVIGDIRLKESAEQIFTKFSPELVFHAAAYKHVPLMEHCPLEAIRTNIFGTMNIADLCVKYNTQRMVLISTDKAVNPTNVMGATKRIAEMICLDRSKMNSETKFMMVRFGNVLGSSGSVIPLFKKQIKKGGPVTVTHPEITRYFMSIPEAAQLVIEAQTMGEGGEIFVLDMGEPFKIYDVARKMIELSGFIPDKEITIEFSGLRPGEKLYEELLADKENTLPTKHHKVKIANSRNNRDDFSILLNELLALTENSSHQQIKSLLKKIVPEYTPQ